MKTRLAFLAVTALAALTLAPAALASGKPDDAVKHADKAAKHAERAACGPRVGVVLRGSLVTVDVATSTVEVKVERTNDHGARYAGQMLKLVLGPDVEIRRHGPATLADLVLGDVVKLKARACKKQLHDPAATPELAIRRLKAHEPDAGKDEAAKPEEQKPADTPQL